MKKLLLLLPLALAIVTLTKCKKIDELTTFRMSYDSQVTVPANGVINLPLDILTPDITTNYQQQFSANDTRSDLVNEINIDGITITVKSPANQNLDFLKSINVYIAAEGMAEKEIASKNDIPDGLSSLSLDYVSDNLKDYLTKDKIKLRVKTVTDKALTNDTELNIKTDFKVKAKIL